MARDTFSQAAWTDTNIQLSFIRYSHSHPCLSRLQSPVTSLLHRHGSHNTKKKSPHIKYIGTKTEFYFAHIKYFRIFVRSEFEKKGKDFPDVVVCAESNAEREYPASRISSTLLCITVLLVFAHLHLTHRSAQIHVLLPFISYIFFFCVCLCGAVLRWCWSRAADGRPRWFLCLPLYWSARHSVWMCVRPKNKCIPPRCMWPTSPLLRARCGYLYGMVCCGWLVCWMLLLLLVAASKSTLLSHIA